MNEIYVVHVCGRYAMLLGNKADRDSIHAGPFETIGQAEAEINRLQMIGDRKGTVRAVAWAVALIALCGWALPSLISDERLEARGVAVETGR